MVLRAFGHIREALGNTELEVAGPIGDVGALRTFLIGTYPSIQWSSVAIAINRQYAQDDEPLSSNDEIALIPPVSGG